MGSPPEANQANVVNGSLHFFVCVVMAKEKIYLHIYIMHYIFFHDITSEKLRTEFQK